MNNHILVGHTTKTHGLGGEIKLKIDEAYAEDILQCEVLFFELRGKPMPYFVEKLRGGGGEFIVKLEDVNLREDAQVLTSRSVFLRESDLLPDEAREAETEQLGFEHCVGFRLEDETLGFIGEVEAIVEYPQQEMAYVTYKGVEKMVPLNDVFVKMIDSKLKLIKVDLPEGLLEI